MDRRIDSISNIVSALERDGRGQNVGLRGHRRLLTAMTLGLAVNLAPIVSQSVSAHPCHIEPSDPGGYDPVGLGYPDSDPTWFPEHHDQEVALMACRIPDKIEITRGDEIKIKVKYLVDQVQIRLLSLSP